MENECEKCARCGRALKSPQSRQRCFGPVCYAKVQAEVERTKREEEREEEPSSFSRMLHDHMNNQIRQF